MALLEGFYYEATVEIVNVGIRLPPRSNLSLNKKSSESRFGQFYLLFLFEHQFETLQRRKLVFSNPQNQWQSEGICDITAAVLHGCMCTVCCLNQ